MPVEIHDCECIAETEKAILVEINEWGEEDWVPKSQIHDDSEVYEKDTSGTLIVSGWFAREKGWD